MQDRYSHSNLLTTGEVAHLLHIHINTARRWSNRGLLPACRIGPRRDRRFRREDVLRLLAGPGTPRD